MNCEDARRNFAEYWHGTLDSAGMDALESHLKVCEGCRAEADGLKEIWGALGEMPEEQPGIGLRSRFYASLRDWEQHEIARRHRSWWMPHPMIQIAAGLVILVSGLVIGNLTARNAVSNPGQVAQLEKEVNSMRQLVTLSLLQQQNASDRLRGVTWSYRVEQSDSEVLAALLTAVNHDPNVNVRLAAVDALHNFADSPVGRRGLVQALGKQTSPLVQIAILDQIVDLHDKTASPAIQKLAETAELNPEVKEHATWALRQLQ
ncbi:MAG TPA: zf-HC2 domain-containing protein [Bryobacteraceae bacterium]|nr:zf-HC2 domain-containing protein [Bryobacteraceae bacterium]